MVADEDRSVEALIQPLHHAHRLVEALNYARARVKLFDEEVTHDPMRVVHEDLIRAAFKGAKDRRVRVAGHEDPTTLVVGSMGKDVLWICHRRSALHVDGDEHFHAALLSNAVTLLGGSVLPAARRAHRRSGSEQCPPSRSPPRAVPSSTMHSGGSSVPRPPSPPIRASAGAPLVRGRTVRRRAGHSERSPPSRTQCWAGLDWESHGRI